MKKSRVSDGGVGVWLSGVCVSLVRLSGASEVKAEAKAVRGSTVRHERSCAGPSHASSTSIGVFFASYLTEAPHRRSLLFREDDAAPSVQRARLAQPIRRLITLGDDCVGAAVAAPQAERDRAAAPHDRALYEQGYGQAPLPRHGRYRRHRAQAAGATVVADAN